MNYLGRVYRLDIGSGSEVRTFDGFPSVDQSKAPAQIQFTVDQSPSAEHAYAEITLYGLGRQSREEVYRKYDAVRLTAGYVEGFGLIFEGNISNVSIGREGAETFVRLFCQSAADVWGSAYINQSFGASTPQLDIIRAVAETFNRTVEVVGDFSDLPRAIKGRTLSQDSKSAMDELARSFGFSWLVSGGKTLIIRDGARWPGAQPYRYSARTGLIGSPELTEAGANINVLLNPFVRPRDLFEVEAETWAPTYSGIYSKARAKQVTGEYQVMSLRHEGDFYGDRWQTTLTGRRAQLV